MLILYVYAGLRLPRRLPPRAFGFYLLADFYFDFKVFAMSLLSRGLYPTQAVLDGWDTVTSGVTWAGVEPAQWTAVSTKLGDANVDMPMLVAAIPVHLLVKAVQEWSDEAGPTTMEKVRMGLLINAVRLKFHMDLVDLLPPPPGAPPAAAPAPPVMAPPVTPPPGVKVKLSTVIDQGTDQEVTMLPAETLTNMRRRYITAFGDEPLQRAEVTDTQLTALNFKCEQGVAPYADFGVWGPHGARLERKMRFTSHVVSPDGTWRTVEMPGADCLDTWRECWAVFRTAALMCAVALPATLDMYAQLFEDRCKRYPGAWHLCAQADIRCRSEFMVDERRRQERFHTAHPTMSSFDVAMPWNSVMKAAAKATEFWDLELKEPALLYALGHGRSHPTFVSQQPAAMTQPGGGGGGGGRGNKRKRDKHKAPVVQAPPPAAPPGGGKALGKGKGGKGRNGKHNKDRNGKELCFAWNRSPGGCTTGQCPQGRSHLCELCLQPHRTIDHNGGEGGAQQGGQRPS